MLISSKPVFRISGVSRGERPGIEKPLSENQTLLAKDKFQALLQDASNPVPWRCQGRGVGAVGACWDDVGMV